MTEPGAETRGIPLHTKILIGLVVGAVVGIAANQFLGPDSRAVVWANTYLAGPIGQIFLRILFMIVIPLIFASIALGVAGIGDVRKLGRIGGKSMAYFGISTALAATVGLTAVSVIKPGEQLDDTTRAELMTTYASAASSRIEAQQEQQFGINTIVSIVTRNPIKSAVDGDLLGVIFFSLLFGAALTLIPIATAKPMIDVLTALNDVVIKIVDMAMRLAPWGVAGLIFGMTSTFGFALLKPLGLYVAIVIGALLVHVFVTLALIIRFYVGMSPGEFIRRASKAIVTAFSTSSSSGTLPTSIETGLTRFGYPKELVGFVLPLGATMNMNGTSLFEGVTIIFLAQVFGVDLSLGQMIVVMLMAVITAIGAAGVPGGSIPLLVGILAMFRVPPEGIGIILGIDRILDMSRTTVNVFGDLVATAVVGRSEKIWDPSMLPSRS